MAHQISKHADGRNQVFTSGNAPWHHLGVNVQSAQKWQQVIKLAAMDITIDKFQLEYQGKPVNAYGLFRSDTGSFVHSCGSDYTVIQATDAFEFVDSIIDVGNGCHYTSAGMLFNGEMIFCNVEIPEAIRIRGTDDITKVNLLFADYRNGKAATVHNCFTRTVCWNTFQRAMKEDGFIFKFRHSSGVHDKMKSAKEILIKEKAEVKSIEEKLNILSRKKATDKVIAGLLEKLFPKINESTRSQNMARDILQRFEENDGNAFPSERGTAYNLLNAVTGYIDHDKSVRLGDDIKPEQSKQIEYVKRAENAMFGTGNAFKNTALEYILEAVETVPEMSEKQIFDMSKKSKIDSILDQVAI